MMLMISMIQQTTSLMNIVKNKGENNADERRIHALLLWELYC